MRWETLFADLERYFEDFADSAFERPSLDDSPVMAPAGTDRDIIVTFSRLKSTREPISLTLIDGISMEIVVKTVGADWLSGAPVGKSDSSIIFPLSGLVSFIAPGSLPVAPPGSAARVSLSEALRVWARNSAFATVSVLGAQYSGRIIGAGVDYLDLESGPARIRRIRMAAICRITPDQRD